MFCPYSKDATNPSDTLLYAKILLKRSELFCLNLKVEDGLLDVEEALDLLKELKGDERNLLYCKFLYAKSIYLDLLDYKEYEQKVCTSLIEQTVEQFNLSRLLREKLDKYHSFLCQVFTANRELIKSEFDKREPKINVNVLKANQKLPGVSSSVEMCVIQGKGRCTRASAPIKDGQLLFVEDPVVCWLRPTMYKSYCNHCLTKIQNHFMTCFNCVKVKYCSGKCRDEAWARYHSVECQFLECLRFLGYGQMVLRTMLQFDQDQMMSVLVDAGKESKEMEFHEKNESESGKSSEGSQNGLGDKQTESDAKENPKSDGQEPWTFTVDEPPVSSFKQLSPRSKFENTQYPGNDHWVEHGFPAELDYQAFFSLVGDEKHLSFVQLLSFCYGVVLLGMFARKMKLIDRDDRFFYIFHSALLSHIFKINFNCYSINDHSLAVERKYNFWTHAADSAKIGIGVYQSSSIISHSCDYNTNKLCLGSRIVIFANQFIRRGSEITHTYGPSRQVTSYKDRQAMLRNGYLFVCKCNACKERLENCQNAFRCALCGTGALIWNQDYSNECSKCKAKDQDLNQLIVKLNESQEQFNAANELLSQGRWTECKQKLDNCQRVVKAVFYSDQKLVGLYMRYMEYYSQRERYLKAAGYAKLLAELQREKDGKECLESVLYSLKAISLSVLHLKSSFLTFPFTSFGQQIPRKRVNKLRDSYLKVLANFNRINSRPVRLLESSYLPFLECFEVVESFLHSVNAEF